MHIEYHFDGWLGAVMTFAVIAILMFKLLIAAQFLGRRNGDPKVRRSINLLIAIFALSAVTAYLPRLVHVPELMLAFMHVALAYAVIRYALSHQADLINDAIKRTGNGNGNGGH